MDDLTKLRNLFIRYIRHVQCCEGVDYINSGSHHNDDAFTQEEWETLEQLAREIDLES
jgi:hypothetical protein